MLDPIRAFMLATIIAWIAGGITGFFVPTGSEWVLSAGACAFIGTLTAVMLLGLRGK